LNEATWFIIVGLFFDICGAILIVGTIVKWKWSYTPGEAMAEADPLRSDKPGSAAGWYAKKRTKYNRLSWFGLGLLGLGFFLQMVGNWLQNPPM